jgi:hypothetical protein
VALRTRAGRLTPVKGLNSYSFSSTWVVDVSPEEAFDVLRDIADYPSWWPEVKEVWRKSDDAVYVRCRSLLPYDLLFSMRCSREDRAAGLLEVAMEGDLEGTTRFTMSPVGSCTRLLFEEDVVTNKSLLNALAPIAKPAFAFNHALMMRHGLAGLRTYLAGYRRARELHTP